MNTNKKTPRADTSQHEAGRVAGFMFLFFIVASILHYTVVELNLIVSDNTSEIANFIKINELLFRVGIAIDLILFISGIILSMALYVILKPVNKNLVLFALIMMLIQVTVAVVIELSSFSVLLLVNREDYLTVFETEQLQALLGLFLNVRAAGYSIVMLFFSLGFIIFFYLFLKSNYIPKIFAALGIFSFLLMLILTFVKIIIPNYTEIIGQVSSVLVMLFQIIIGLWLLFKGIEVEQQK